MANLSGLYNPEAEAQQDFAPIPSGEYPAQIVESDMKPTKNNDGQYLELKYSVIDGEFKGRSVWVRLNLDNKNVQAVEIANRQFASIRDAIGVTQVNQSEELHYKPHTIRVELIPAGTPQRGGGVSSKAQNEIRGWKKLDDGIPFATAPSTPAAAPRQNAAPWPSRSAA